MAKKKISSPQSTDNGTDTDVLDDPKYKDIVNKAEKFNEDNSADEPKPKGTIEDWGAVLAKEEAKPVPIKKDEKSQEQDDEQLLADIAAKVKKDGGEEKIDDDQQKTPVSVLDAMTKDADNEFSLDDAEKKEDGTEGESKEGEPLKPKDKQTDADIVSRIAKEFEISDAQTPEQLISSIKEKLSTAKAGADAPVAGIDKVLALNNRDLYKTFLMRQSKFSDERAEKYITERMETFGEEWIDQKAEDVRIDLEAARERIVQDHVSREMAKEKDSKQFVTTARQTVKEIKTIFGKIPLKEHVAQLKEFQAQISTDEGLNAMRNDPKKLVEAMFLLNFGGGILESFLESKMSEAEKEGWRKSYKTNVKDKILNQSKQREQTEYPNTATNPKDYKEGGWEDNV